MMADINIERKKRSPLPWIIGLLVLALLAFFLMRNRDDDADATGGTTVDTTVSTTAPPS
jgi:preprotein translocase subunit SecF